MLSTNEEPSLAKEEDAVEDLDKFLAEIDLNDVPNSDTLPQIPPVAEETKEKEECLWRWMILQAPSRVLPLSTW